MSYQLSICIPTYNREKYLKQLLDCILNQLKDIEGNIIEICVSDNASTDNTQQILQQYQKKYNNITYFRWDKNMGADMNYLKVVEIAHSKYCWFFGSDDLMVDGAIKKILEEIKENHDIYLCNAIQCDINMNEKLRLPIFKKSINTKTFKLNNNKDVLNYFNSIELTSSVSTMGILAYLSSIIFKKEQWDSIKFDKNFIDTAYAHTYILLSLFKKNITLKYIYDFLVLARGSNDSFLINGITKRILLDFYGFKKLFTTIFVNDEKLANYYKNFLKKHYSYSIISGIYNKVNNDDRKLLLSFVKETHNIHLIKLINLFYIIYRGFIKKPLQKLNIHQKIVKILFLK